MRGTALCQRDDVKLHRRTRGYRADLSSWWRRLGAHQLYGSSVAAALISGCSAPAVTIPPVLPIVATPIKPAPPVPPEPLGDDAPPALDAVLVERVAEGTFGPYVGAAPGGRALAIWAAPAEGAGWRWFSAVLDPKGVPLAPPRALAEAPNELSLASVAGTASGFVALATGLTPTGTRVEALQLGPAGELTNGPTPLVYSRTEVLWVKALRIGDTNVALWATLAVGAADILFVPLTAAGAQQAAPLRVLEGARAWQATPFSDGIALAAVIAGVGEASRTLLVAFLDSDGRLIGKTEIRSGAGLDDQVDAARVGDNLVVSWTEREGADQRLYLAALGPDTRLLASPEAAAPVFGRQRLIQLLPASEPRGDALLAWEQVGQAPRAQRRIQLARVTDRGRATPARAVLELHGDSAEAVELARRGKGVGALTRAAACAPGAATCETPEPVPTFVELGPDLDPIASEPVRLATASGKLADLAWGLHCAPDACSALAALPAAPVPIYGVDLRARSRAWPMAASRVEATLPRALEMRTISEGGSLADVNASRLGQGWLVASVTQFDERTPYVRRKTPAPDGKLAPVRAVLGVQTFSSDGRAELNKIISYRARSTSGTALCRLSDERALLAWTALDQQRPEVFATLLGKNGAPKAQRMLTSNAGDVTALAAAPLVRGSVVAWIADRDGEARLFAARLNEELIRTAPEQRLSTAGGFTGLSLARRRDEAWLASTRRAEGEELVSITRLDPKTAARRGDELALRRSESSALSSPVIVSTADGALVAWVERPLVGGGDVASAFLVELDAQARRVGEPIRVLSKTGDPAAVRLYCEGGLCQGVLDARPPEGALLEGFDIRSGAPPEARVLAYRASDAVDTAALAVVDSAIFYADRIEQRGLLRRAAISWR